MRGVLTQTRDSFHLADDVGVSGAQARAIASFDKDCSLVFVFRDYLRKYD